MSGYWRGMAEEHLEIVRGMYEAYLSGETRRALAYHHPEVVATWLGTLDDYTERIDDVRDLGDKVPDLVAEWSREEKRHRSSTQPAGGLGQVLGSSAAAAIGESSSALIERPGSAR